MDSIANHKTDSGFKGVLSASVIVASLGYFVDIYDLSLFSIVRIPSLKGIGIVGENLTSQGTLLIQIQMMGMLVGGLVWGILGDLKGRLSVLYGSIVMYSLANIANGFVQDFKTYEILRFIAGIGLAGELGAGITLVSESLSPQKRGYGTMLVACIGAMGAILAHFVSEFVGWRYCYFIGGGLGLALLILRIGVMESGMFHEVKTTGIKRGNFLLFFTNWKRFQKYILTILVGVPVWYCVGILITFSPELAKNMHVIPDVTSAGKSVMFCYLGLVVGDLFSGLLSQFLKSRKKVIAIYLFLSLILSFIYLNQKDSSQSFFYLMCFLIGAGTGYWVLFCSAAAEQFGTNLRSTAATTIPNFVRGAVVPLTALFSFFKSHSFSVIESAGILGIISIGIALLSLLGIKETFGNDLKFTEE